MTKEQEKAIYRLNRRINQLKLNFAITNEDLDAIETVLSIIEEQDKEIKELKQSKIRQLERYKRYKENIDNQHEKIYEDLVEETEFKDKIISLMAEYIEQIDASGDLCKRCKEIDWNEYDDCCKECIKQYFENKAKEV